MSHGYGRGLILACALCVSDIVIDVVDFLLWRSMITHMQNMIYLTGFKHEKLVVIYLPLRC